MAVCGRAPSANWEAGGGGWRAVATAAIADNGQLLATGWATPHPGVNAWQKYMRGKSTVLHAYMI